MQQFFSFFILTFIYISSRFGLFPADYQKLDDCSGSLWFYLRIVVTVVLCSWSGRQDNKLKKLLHQVGDLFELNLKLRCQKVNQILVGTSSSPLAVLIQFSGRLLFCCCVFQRFIPSLFCSFDPNCLYSFVNIEKGICHGFR